MYIDPRGIRRKIKSIESTPEYHLISYEECNHITRGTRHMHFTVGAYNYCLKCGKEAHR